MRSSCEFHIVLGKEIRSSCMFSVALVWLQFVRIRKGRIRDLTEPAGP
jgi:hypothetical protein